LGRVGRNELGVEVRCLVVREAVFRQAAGGKVRVADSALRDVCRVTHRRVDIPSRDMANAAEAVAAGTGKGHQDRLDPAAQRQVRMPTMPAQILVLP
jgi:hypothetical protein